MLMKPMVRNFIIALMAAAGLFASVFCSAKDADKQEKLFTEQQAKEKFQKAFQITDSLWYEPFNVYPDNRLYVDIKNKTLHFISKDGDKSWAYDNVKNNNNVKKLESGEASASFQDWLEEYVGKSTYDKLDDDIKIHSEYAQKIAQSSLSDENKIFSLFYNALVGDANGYVCAYINEDNEFVKVSHDYYGKKIVLDVSKFINVMSTFEDKKDLDGKNAYNFLKENEVILETPKIGYLNYREDKYLLMPDKNGLDLNTIGKDLVNLIKDNPGKVFYAIEEDGKLVDLKDLKGFYEVSNHCLNITEDKLKSYKYVEPDNKLKDKLLVVIGVAVILLIAAGLATWMLLKRKKNIHPAPKTHKKHRDDNPKENKSPDSPVEPAAVEPAAEVSAAEVPNPLLEKLTKLAEDPNPRPSDILRAFDEEFKKKSVEKYHHTVKAANAYVALKNEVGSGKASIEELAAAVDKTFFGEKQPYTAAFEKRMKDANEDAKKYNDLINLTSEETVMENLDAIRKAKKSFPEIVTVRREVEKALGSSDDKTKQVSRFLSSASADMFDAFDSLVKDATSYKTMASALRNLNPDKRADQYLAELIDGLAKKASASAAEYIDFVLNFKSADQALDESLQKSASEASEKYAKVDDAVAALVSASGFIAKDEADHWERLAFIFAMAACAKDLYVAYGNDQTAKVDKAMDTLKSDMLKLFISKIFMLVAPNADKPYEILKTALGSRVPKGVAAFNAMVGREELTHETPEIQDYTEQHLIALMKIRNAEKNDVFYREMWDKYVMDFAEKLRANTDKGWLLSNSVQIAFYFSDFLKHMIGGVDVYYCNNYNYMMSKTLLECEADYEEHHIQYSDNFSDFVYSFLKEYGAKDVDVMAGNFRIKM